GGTFGALVPGYQVGGIIGLTPSLAWELVGYSGLPGSAMATGLRWSLLPRDSAWRAVLAGGFSAPSYGGWRRFSLARDIGRLHLASSLLYERGMGIPAIRDAWTIAAGAEYDTPIGIHISTEYTAQVSTLPGVRQALSVMATAPAAHGRVLLRG